MTPAVSHTLWLSHVQSHVLWGAWERVSWSWRSCSTRTLWPRWAGTTSEIAEELRAKSTFLWFGPQEDGCGAKGSRVWNICVVTCRICWQIGCEKWQEKKQGTIVLVTTIRTCLSSPPNPPSKPATALHFYRWEHRPGSSWQVPLPGYPNQLTEDRLHVWPMVSWSPTCPMLLLDPVYSEALEGTPPDAISRI